MNNSKINLSRIVSYVTLGTAILAVVAAFVATDPGRALGHSLNAAAYLLLSLHLLFRPGASVLYVAVFLVSVLSALALAGDLKYGLFVGELRLLELFVALLAVGLTEVLTRRGERA